MTAKKKKPKKKGQGPLLVVAALFAVLLGGTGHVVFTTLTTNGEAAEAKMNDLDLELLDALRSVDPDTSRDELVDLLGPAESKGDSLVFDGANSFSWVRVKVSKNAEGEDLVEKIQWVKVGAFAWETTPRWD